LRAQRSNLPRKSSDIWDKINTVNTFVGSFLDRDWALIARSKAQHWRRLFDEKGPGAALRAAEGLRASVRLRHPGWPTEEERARDFDDHVRLAALFALARRNRP